MKREKMWCVFYDTETKCYECKMSPYQFSEFERFCKSLLIKGYIL